MSKLSMLLLTKFRDHPRAAFAFWTIVSMSTAVATIRAVARGDAVTTLVATLATLYDLALACLTAPKAGVLCLIRHHHWKFEYDSPHGAITVSTPRYGAIGDAVDRARQAFAETKVDTETLTLLDVSCTVCDARPNPSDIPSL